MYLYKLLIMQKFLEAKAHMGNCSTYSDTQPYIYGFRNNIAIIDLEKTLICLRRACNVIDLIIRSKGHLLFVNTNSEYNKIVKETAMRTNQSFINHKWIGGFLTNWNHMQNVQQHFHLFEPAAQPSQSRNQLEILQGSKELAKVPSPGAQSRERSEPTDVPRNNGPVASLLRKGSSQLVRQNLTKRGPKDAIGKSGLLTSSFGPRFKKMQKCFEGTQSVALPDCVIIFNANQNSIAIHEASLLQIPINSNISNKLHSLITYPIPANENSVRLIYIVCNCFLKTILLCATKEA
jgi:ribosomal protein S2